jgi:outer membrane lipoprotein-sorting protein
MQIPRFLYLLIFSLLIGNISAQQVSTNNRAEEILLQVDKNLTPPTFEAYRKLINEEPDGSSKEYIFFSVKKGKDKMALLYLSPASEKGRATLRLGDNMWLYIPNVGRPIRITSLQSVVGGIFNNSDIMRLEYSFEYNPVILEENESEYILELKAKSKSVAYDRLKMWVDKDNIHPAKVECYTATGKMIKILEFKDIQDFGDGIIRPAVIQTTSPLYKGYRSVMIFSGIKARQLPDEVFTLEYLSRLSELR